MTSIDCWVIAINFLDYQMRLIRTDVYRISRGQWIVIWLIYWFGKCVRRTEWIPANWRGTSQMAMALFPIRVKASFQDWVFFGGSASGKSWLRSAKQSTIFLIFTSHYNCKCRAQRIFTSDPSHTHTPIHTHRLCFSFDSCSLKLNLVFMRAN